MTEIEAALDRLIASPLLTQLDATRLGVNDDGSGIDVGIQGTDPPGAAVIAQLRDLSGIDDITVSTGRKPMVAFGSRQADSSPWRGGARIWTPTGGGCTSGFAVLVGSAGRLLSARHCVVNDSNTVVGGPITSGGGTQISPTGGFSVNYTIDSLLIDPSASPATVPRIYRGAYNSSTYSTVRSWANNNYNDFVCNSGATTGEHCGYIYDDNDVVFFNGAWVQVARVAAPSGSIFAGEGDSGGPVFKPLSNGAQARGIILGADLDAGPTTTSCGATSQQGIVCSRWIIYVRIGVILNTWGVQLEVG